MTAELPISCDFSEREGRDWGVAFDFLGPVSLCDAFSDLQTPLGQKVERQLG